MILSIEGIEVYYGQSHVLHNVSLEIEQGRIIALLGRNGVGKTTLLRAVLGLTPPRSGKITYKGRDITHMPAYETARLGIGYVPQGREIFASLTVRENLALGTIIRSGRISAVPKEISSYFPILEERLDQKGGTLSGGQQQMLAIGRAIAGGPDLLLLDEPSEGIQPSIVESLKEAVRQLNVERGLSILLVEQNTEFAFDLADYCYVLEKGQICSAGKVADIRNNEIICRHLAV
jgi:urea transport system ATP-binding protein